MTPSRLTVREGSSTQHDAIIAVREIQSQIQQDTPHVVLFFCSPTYDLPALGQALRDTFPGVVIGCTTAGQLGEGGFTRGGITAVSIGGPLEATSYLVDLAEGAGSAADIAEIINGRLVEEERRRPFGLLLVDGLSLAEERLTAELYQHLANVPIIGGSAGDDLAFERTYVYCDGVFRSGVASFTLFLTELPFTTFKFDHFQPTDRLVVVTASDPTRRIVWEINGEPAAIAYAQMLGVEPGELTSEVCAKHPLILQLDGEQYVRSIASVNPDHSLTLFCAIEDGVVLSVGETLDPASTAQLAFDRVRARIGALELVIGCDCILRRLEFTTSGLLDDMGQIMAANRVLGFSTYGEQFNAVHVNQTFTGIALGG